MKNSSKTLIVIAALAIFGITVMGGMGRTEMFTGGFHGSTGGGGGFDWGGGIGGGFPGGDWLGDLINQIMQPQQPIFLPAPPPPGSGGSGNQWLFGGSGLSQNEILQNQIDAGGQFGFSVSAPFAPTAAGAAANIAHNERQAASINGGTYGGGGGNNPPSAAESVGFPTGGLAGSAGVGMTGIGAGGGGTGSEPRFPQLQNLGANIGSRLPTFPSLGGLFGGR